MRIEDFNALPAEQAAAALRACAAIDSWVHVLAAGRPYDDAGQLLAAARAQAATWTPAEVEAALADHPRIGERPAGTGASAAASAREQAGLDPADIELAAALRAGNDAYEEKFGRIYLVRARGRTGPELLALLRQRLENDPESEYDATVQQLQEIAVLRLEGLIA